MSEKKTGGISRVRSVRINGLVDIKPEEILKLAKTKKILVGSKVFESELKSNELETMVTNRLKVNEQAKKSMKTLTSTTKTKQINEDKKISEAKSDFSKNDQSDSLKTKQEIDRLQENTDTDLVQPQPEVLNQQQHADMKKKEEWDELPTSEKLEFWKDHSITKGDFYHGFAIKGWRESMEDFFDTQSTIKQGVPNLFGVYDGHGGVTCSNYCRMLLLTQISKRADIRASPEIALPDAFLNIDIDYNKDHPESKAGTTASVLLIHPVKTKKAKGSKKRSEIPTGASMGVESPRHKTKQKKSGVQTTSERIRSSLRKSNSQRFNKREFKFFLASVGDSRAVLVYKSGKTVALSVDHNLQRKDEFKRITDGEGEIKFDPEFEEFLIYSETAKRGLAVTRTIGDHDFKPLVTALPDIKTGFITGDVAYFVIASDGLWNHVSNDEVGRVMTQYGKIKGLKNLANLANKRGCGDNITLLAVEVPKMVKSLETALEETDVYPK